MSHQIFISYSSEDQVTAQAVRAGLERHGIRCWMAPEDILPGEDFPRAIARAIKASQVMVLIYSSRIFKSEYVKSELEIAFKNGVLIAPFRIEKVEPDEAFELYLSRPHWLEAYTPPLHQHVEELAKTLCRVLKLDYQYLPPPGDIQPPVIEPTVSVDPPSSHRGQWRQSSILLVSIFAITLLVAALIWGLPLLIGRMTAEIGTTPEFSPVPTLVQVFAEKTQPAVSTEAQPPATTDLLWIEEQKPLIRNETPGEGIVPTGRLAVIQVKNGPELKLLANLLVYLPVGGDLFAESLPVEGSEQGIYFDEIRSFLVTEEPSGLMLSVEMNSGSKLTVAIAGGVLFGRAVGGAVKVPLSEVEGVIFTGEGEASTGETVRITQRDGSQSEVFTDLLLVEYYAPFGASITGSQLTLTNGWIIPFSQIATIVFGTDGPPYSVTIQMVNGRQANGWLDVKYRYFYGLSHLGTMKIPVSQIELLDFQRLPASRDSSQARVNMKGGQQIDLPLERMATLTPLCGDHLVLEHYLPIPFSAIRLLEIEGREGTSWAKVTLQSGEVIVDSLRGDRILIADVSYPVEVKLEEIIRLEIIPLGGDLSPVRMATIDPKEGLPYLAPYNLLRFSGMQRSGLIGIEEMLRLESGLELPLRKIRRLEVQGVEPGKSVALELTLDDGSVMIESVSPFAGLSGMAETGAFALYFSQLAAVDFGE